MMSFKLFKEIVLEELPNYFPEEYGEIELELVVTDKINHKKEGINVRPKGQTVGLSTTIYLEEYYEQYKNGFSMEFILSDLAETYQRSEERKPNMGEDFEIYKAKDRIIFSLINTEQNKELLKDMPHREFLDMSIIYHWVVKIDNGEIAHIRVTNDTARFIHMNEENLYMCAKENMDKLLPPVIRPITEVIGEMLGGDKSEIGTDGLFHVDAGANMHVLTNSMNQFGATMILDENKLHALAETIGKDLYILPSSIHEMLAVPCDLTDVKQLEEMVYEVNTTVVEIGERLSNEVYKYDKTKRELTIATDCPTKRLDGGAIPIEISLSTPEISR